MKKSLSPTVVEPVREAEIAGPPVDDDEGLLAAVVVRPGDALVVKGQLLLVVGVGAGVQVEVDLGTRVTLGLCN